MHAGLVVEFRAGAVSAVSCVNRAGIATTEEIRRAVTVVLQSRFAAVMTRDAGWMPSVPATPSNAMRSLHGARARDGGTVVGWVSVCPLLQRDQNNGCADVTVALTVQCLPVSTTLFP